VYPPGLSSGVALVSLFHASYAHAYHMLIALLYSARIAATYLWVRTATRKELFKILDSVVQGEPATITYKGAEVLLQSPSGGSKLARAVKRDTLLVDPDSIIGSDTELMKELGSKWEDEDKLF